MISLLEDIQNRLDAGALLLNSTNQEARSAGCRSWNPSTCRWAKCFTNRHYAEPRLSFQRPPSFRCCMSWKTAPQREIAVIGNEGIVGISLFMGGESTSSRAVVQSAGKGFRLKAQLMEQEFNRAGPVLHLFLRYTQALITQMSQTAVCNRHHSLDQQLCRWLLLSLDRLEGNQLVMTQELIANMLGVRREGVTEGALKLQHAGLIQYARGHITVLDRAALEKRSCECYAVVKKEYDRLLPVRLITCAPSRAASSFCSCALTISRLISSRSARSYACCT
jgi:hypothetical protein